MTAKTESCSTVWARPPQILRRVRQSLKAGSSSWTSRVSQHEDGLVVALCGVAGKPADRRHDLIEQRLRRERGVGAHALNQAFFTEFLPFRVERLGDTIGEDDDEVAGREGNQTLVVLGVLKRSDDGAA